MSLDFFENWNSHTKWHTNSWCLRNFSIIRVVIERIHLFELRGAHGVVFQKVSKLALGFTIYFYISIFYIKIKQCEKKKSAFPLLLVFQTIEFFQVQSIYERVMAF